MSATRPCMLSCGAVWCVVICGGADQSGKVAHSVE